MLPMKDAVESFNELAEVFDIDFPYKDNPLPMLQKAILAKAATFRGQMENGWITSLYKANMPTEDTDFTGDDEAPWEE